MYLITDVIRTRVNMEASAHRTTTPSPVHVTTPATRAESVTDVSHKGPKHKHI